MEQITLHDGDMSVALLDHGARTQGWWLGDTPLILGYDDPSDYVTDPYFLGAIVGRVANRIGGAAFDLDGARYQLDANEGANQLHGGDTGFWRQVWQIRDVTRTTARMTLRSPDGAGGYPGAVEVDLRVRLAGSSLTYDLEARTDRPTPISIAQHNYYCLGDAPDVLGHLLQVAADHTLGIDPQLIPTGALCAVDTGPLDFRKPRTLAEVPGGVDDFFVFAASHEASQPCVVLTSTNGLALRVFSDQPGSQIYTGHGLAGRFVPCAGACIEPSGYPNAVNRPAFPSMIATPDRPYRQTLRLDIAGSPF